MTPESPISKPKAVASKAKPKASPPPKAPKTAPKAAAEASPAATSLAVVEERHPVTIAFDYMFQKGLATASLRDHWQADLTQAVTEGAKKFVGFNNSNAMRKSLDINLGLLSLALLIQAEGQSDLEKWAQILAGSSVKELLKEAVGQVRALKYDWEYLFPTFDEPPLRETVLRMAQSREYQRKNVWNGYSLFLEEKRRLKGQQAADEVVRILIEKLLKKDPETWANPSEMERDPEERLLTSEETINTILLRHCTLKKGERIPSHIRLSFEFLKKLRKEYEAKPEVWLAETEARFNEMVSLLPVRLRPYLSTPRSWFATHLKAGPPNIAKKTDMGEEADHYELTGVYACEVY